jgi:hypothetical protein
VIVAAATSRARFSSRFASGTLPLAGVLLLGGCQTGPSPALGVPGSMVAGTAMQPHVAPNLPVTFGSIIVCGSDSTPVTVTGVTLPSSTGGLRVSGFAIRPNPSGSGGAPVGMADAPLTSPLIGVDGVGPGLVAPCEAGGAGGSEVLVEVRRAALDDGCAADGIDLHYVSGSDPTEAVLHIPLALAVGEGDAPCT